VAGILNSKQRIMDVIVTKNGRRQIVNGSYNVRYISFSDHGVFYREDESGVADDASSRIMFEAFSRPCDTLIPEIDSYGNISVESIGTQKITNGSVFNVQNVAVSGSLNIYSSSLGVMSQSVKHFDYLQMIGNKTTTLENKTFELTNNTFYNDINKKSAENIINIDDVPPFITDPRFANNICFAYKPPVYEVANTVVPLATYSRISEFPPMSIKQIKRKLLHDGAQVNSFSFKSNEGVNALAQIFEHSENSIQKLSIIDYGHYSENGRSTSVYHVGKIIKDLSGRSKFFKLLTLIFE